MNKNQISQVNMRGQIKDLYNRTPVPFFLLMPMFTVWYTLFNDIMIAFNLYLAEQETERIGLQENKTALRFSLTAFAIELSAIIHSFATATDNIPLQFDMNYNKSQLDRLNVIPLIAIARLIHTSATENLADLVDYNVTALTLTNFNTAIDLLEAATPKPEAGKLARRTATLAIQGAMRESKVFLVKMDGVVRTITRTEPTFTGEWFRARKIHKLPTTILAIRGNIKNAAEVPMPYVQITCATLDLNRKATQKGGFTVKNGEPGIHHITFFFPGFQTVVQEVTIWSGLRSEVNVTMHPHL